MTKLKLYNTITRKKEDFQPIDSGKVRMYTCGPTVHDFAHIGNYRAYTFEDLLRRVLKYFGFQVTQVMNITDVEDKTIRKSQEQELSLSDYTERYKAAFFDDLDELRIERAEFYPSATEHVDEMVDLIQKLIEKGYTYEADGSIYFRISAFEEYGRLANIQPDKLISGLRVDTDEYEKEDVRDFVLWKAWVPEDGDVYWETQLGKGRPGWHIECSAMSTMYLGTHFDIHTGGVDNIFPHHENEIAQSICGYDDKFVNLWLHNAHLIINSEKMSKSLNNFYTLRELKEAGVSSRAVRYFLLSAHYRQPLNLIYDQSESGKGSFEAAKGALDRIDEFRTRLHELTEGNVNPGVSNPEVSKFIDRSDIAFEKSLANDLDISGALGALFSLIKDVNRMLAANSVSCDDAKTVESQIVKWDRVLSILEPDEKAEIDEDYIQTLIDERIAAKKAKDFARADAIRKELDDKGIILQDTPDGTRWRRK